MGAEPWSSFTKFDSDVQRALDNLAATCSPQARIATPTRNRRQSKRLLRSPMPTARRRFLTYSKSQTNLIFVVRRHSRLTN